MKKTAKLIIALLLCAGLFSALSLTAFAADAGFVMSEDGSAQLTGTQDRTVFLAGQTVDCSAEVKGIVMAAGYNLYVGGSGEYVMAAGYNAAVNGAVEKDAFAAGYSTVLNGEAQRDVFLVGNDVALNGEAGRNLFAGGTRVTINGKVGGDVYVSADSIVIGSDADIAGCLRYNDNADISIRDGSRIGSTATYVGTSADQSYEETESVPESGAHKVWVRVRTYLGLAAVAFVLLWLTPIWAKLDGKYTGQPFGKYATAFGIGFGVLAGVPLAAILLMVTQIGLRLAFVLLMLYAALIIAAPVFLSFFLGGLIWRRLLKKAPCYAAELPIGILAWWIADMIPVLSAVTALVSVPFGVGVVALLLGNRKAPPVSAPVAEEPAALPPAGE